MKVSVFQVVVILIFGLVMVTGVFGKSIRVRDINREELETDTDVIRTFLFCDHNNDSLEYFPGVKIFSFLIWFFMFLLSVKSDEQTSPSNPEELLTSLKLIEMLVKKDINDVGLDQRKEKLMSTTSEESNAASSNIRVKPKRNRGILNLPLGFGK